jgi:hypothetical protein
MNGHLSEDQMQLLAAHELGGDEETVLRRHLAICGACTSAYAAVADLHGALGAMRVLTPSSMLTHNVLSRIGAPRRASVGTVLLENLASVFSVVVVTLMGGAIWSVLALSGTAERQAGAFPGEKILGAGWQWVESTYLGLSGWMSHATPGRGQGVQIAMVLLVIIPVIALVDWFAGRKGPI